MIALAVLTLLQSTWRDMPPPRYRGTATANVFYVDRRNMEAFCTRGAVACTQGSSVFLPVQCSPTRRPMVRTETVNVAEEMRDMSYCASVRAHEFGHVRGWTQAHER